MPGGSASARHRGLSQLTHRQHHEGSCWGLPIPTWACRRAKETPRFLARGSGSPRKDMPPPCVPAKPGLPAGPEPGGVGGSPGPGGVCACVRVCARAGMEGLQAMRRPSPSPTHRRCLSRVPPKKTTRCCKTLLARPQPRGWITEQGPPCPQGLHTCVCVAAAVRVHRGQRTLTRGSVRAAFAHMYLCYACVMNQHPRSSQFRWFTPHKGGASPIA